MRNFEKNIRSAADSFKMEPAEGSFDQVMKALEKKKKRRFLFWLWLFIPGILLAAAWMGINEISKDRIMSLRSDQTRIHINYASDNAYHGKHSDSEENTVITQNTNYTANIHNTDKKELKSEIVKTDHSTTGNNRKHSRSENKNEATDDQKGQDHISTTNRNSSTDPILIKNTPVDKNDQNTSNTNVKTVDTQNNFNVNQSSYVPQIHDVNSEKITVTNNPAVMLPVALNTKRNFSVLSPFKYSVPVIKNKLERFAIGAYAQVGVMKNIFINNRDSITETYTENRREADKYLFSWTGGINFRYSPKPWLSVETGIAYSRYSSIQYVGAAGMSSSNNQDIESADSVYTFASIQNMILPGTQEAYINEYDFLSIPVKIYFQKKWNWIGIEGGAGLAMDIPVYTRSFTVQPNNSFSTFTDRVEDSKLVVGLQVSTQVHAVFHVSRWSFYAGPVFKMRATSMYASDYAIRQHYYFVGAEAGLRFNF